MDKTYTWIGAPGWNPVLGWVEPGQRITLPVLAAGGLAEFAQWLKPESSVPESPSPAVATAPTGETKD